MANIRKRADQIQIGDSIKMASSTTYEVVEHVVYHSGAYPSVVFGLANGSTHRAFPGAFVWWQPAPYAVAA